MGKFKEFIPAQVNLGNSEYWVNGCLGTLLLSDDSNCYRSLIVLSQDNFYLSNTRNSEKVKNAPTSLVDVLRWRALNQPDKLAFRFLVDGESEEATLTYAELDEKARTIAALLQFHSRIQPGDRVLLLLPSGLEFISTYLGCLYAGAIAVPLYPPHPARLMKTLEPTLRIATDASPAVALVNTALFEAISSKPKARESLNGIKLLVTDRPVMSNWAERWQETLPKADDIAFLQYTSGSTASPKGVMVSHGNLMHNLAYIRASFGLSESSRGIFWLPPFHDMGLIGGILQGLFAGYPSTMMPHFLFLQRPLRWLKAIARYQATVSGAPNFAYDLCVQKIPTEQRDQLDLSQWEVAFNGAEKVHPTTMERFAEYFAPCGFRREAFFPCYGLAEATLLVTGGPRLTGGKTLGVEKLAYQHQRIVSDEGEATLELAASGKNLSDQAIRIVDPDSQTLCSSDQIGEIWVKGNSVAQGYWNKPEATKDAFGAFLTDTGEGPFLRTGDLGFMHEETLYVTGRIKNVIISEGRNHHANDLEKTVERCHPAIRTAGVAAFYIDLPDREGVVIIAETPRGFSDDPNVVITAIRKALAEQHALQVHDIRLTIPGAIPRTTSGKIRHFLCKQNYLSQTLKEISAT